MATYSFADLNIVFSHAAMGSISCNGLGIGSITFSRASDIGSHDVAVDGRVVTNKMAGKNGVVTINVQQESELCDWLVRLNNFLENSNAKYFDGLTITANTRLMRRQHTATGCAPQKMPDTAYEQTVGRRAFAYLATTLEEEVA